MIASIDTLPSGARLRADVCIVGGGAAGIALALRLEGRGLDVVLLEAGGRRRSSAAQGLYAGEVAAPALHSPTDHYRHRVLGGSTATWGGRCVPLDPIDFEARDWIPYSGWPIRYETVAAYYPDALALAEAGDCDYRPETAVDGGMSPMIEGYRSEVFDQGNLERFSCPTDFGRRWAGRLAENPRLKVLLDANVTEIVTSPDGTRVDHLEIRTLAGKAFTLAAARVVLATGGLEVPRLLLASRRYDPRGIGNARDWVGRTYMCHIAGSTADVRFKPRGAGIDNGYARTWDGVYVRRRLHLAPEAQRRLRVGNIVLRLHHPRLPDPAHGRGILSLIYLARPFIGYEYAKRLHGGTPLTARLAVRHALNVLGEGVEVGRFLAGWARRRTFAARKFPSLVVQPQNGAYTIDVHSEQAPNRDSRVTLSTRTDPFGMPRVRVDWRYLPVDIATVRTAIGALGEDLAARGLADLTFDPEAVEADMLRDGAFGGHHIGTARMADTPERGVVDADCRVFGLANLYVASSAVFPTSGQANPTLTIVALALRLADHLAGLPRVAA
ncbi:FAD-dependent oxidoreductase [Prosthecomicrobium sp. N25]|uniref:FAD-dependent oxidoreductase n=1 Tax=Prosthecomicrobium sp. N25 TaxID=3129254 RepID=UPI0030787679